MLKILRNHGVKKNIFTGLAVVVVLSFVISGVMIGTDDEKTLSSLAVFEKRKIRVQEYLDNYRAVQRQANMMYGEKLNEMRGQINFKSEAWDRLLLLEYAKKHNIRAGDAETVGWITSQSGFQKDGRFDDTFYKMYIERALRSTPRQFEEEIRQMLTVAKVQERIRQELKLTDDKLRELYKEERTERDLVYGLQPSEALEAQVKVDDAALQQLYDLVKDRLTAPEQSKLRYIAMPKPADGAPAPEEDKKLSLDETAKKYGLTVQETAYFSREDSVAELADWPALLGFAFTGPVGETSIWLENEKGRARATLVDRQPGRPLTLEEARTELQQTLRQDDARRLAVEKLRAVKTKIQNPADFETVLAGEGIAVEKMEKYVKGTYPAGIWPSENLQKAVEKLKEGDVSEAFEVPKGAMIVKVAAVRAADDKKFDEEKKDFRERMEAQGGREQMEKLLEELRGKLSLNVELMKELFPAD